MERQAKEWWVQRRSAMTPSGFEARIKNIGVTNLSRTKISNTQLEILGNNLKFIPSRNILDYPKNQLMKDLDRCQYRIFNSVIYSQDQSNMPRFYIPNPNQSYNTINFDFYKYSHHYSHHYSAARNMASSISSLSQLRYPSLLKRFNLNHRQRILLKSLISDDNLTFKPADKNLGLTILDTESYIHTVETLLKDTSTYKISSGNELLRAAKNFKAFIRSIQLEEDHRKLLEQWFKRRSTKLPIIYYMPKIHKVPLAWRPIIPSVSWMTTPISIIVADLLYPIVKRYTIGDETSTEVTPTIIKDSKSLINIINNLRIRDPNCWLITSDISNLYTNIPTDTGPSIVADLIPNHSILIITLLRKILNNNYFKFNGHIYLQINGTAMGTNCAPHYANLYLIKFELSFINKFKENIIYDFNNNLRNR